MEFVPIDQLAAYVDKKVCAGGNALLIFAAFGASCLAGSQQAHGWLYCIQVKACCGAASTSVLPQLQVLLCINHLGCTSPCCCHAGADDGGRDWRGN